MHATAAFWQLSSGLLSNENSPKTQVSTSQIDKPGEPVTAAAVVRVDRCMLTTGNSVRIKFLSLPVVGFRLKSATRQSCSGDLTIVSGMAHGIHPHISNF